MSDHELLDNFPDEQLLELARDAFGSPEGREAFDEFITRHRAFAVNFARSFLREENAAHDLAQDGFLRLYRMLPGYEATGSARGLLAKLVRNACLSHLRRQGRTVSLATDGRGEYVAEGLAAESPPEAGLERKQAAAQIGSALDALSPQQREIVRLRYFHELSYREISTALGITVNHVGVSLHQALTRLRDVLRPDE